MISSLNIELDEMEIDLALIGRCSLTALMAMIGGAFLALSRTGPAPQIHQRMR